jgi:hypothetical protein
VPEALDAPLPTGVDTRLALVDVVDLIQCSDESMQCRSSTNLLDVAEVVGREEAISCAACSLKT